MPQLRSAPRWAILACLVAATACASRPGTPPVGPREAAAPAPAGHQHVTELPATAGPGFTVADVRFMQHMIGHHAQAIQMAEMTRSHGASERVVRLAEKVDISQRDEIELMKRWLEERDQAVPGDGHSHAMMMMPGMLTAEEFARLGEARGREFDRLFLTFMIRHHEGALQMVEELFQSPGAGQDPDIFRFATDVDADQRDEILVMERLLSTIRG